MLSASFVMATTALPLPEMPVTATLFEETDPTVMPVNVFSFHNSLALVGVAASEELASMPFLRKRMSDLKGVTSMSTVVLP